jgi:uncharacterized membrane protein YhhN
MKAGTMLWSAAIFASAVLTIGRPDLRMGTLPLPYLLTPLTTILTVAFAASGPAPGKARYRWSIVAGLACSVTGDILLMLPRDHFLAGLLCFLVAHVCYLAAFTADCRLASRPFPFVLWGVLGVVALAVLWPTVPQSLRVPVALYACFLLAMASQAASRALCLRTPAAIAASLGSTLFVVSDTLLALKRFGFAVPNSRVLVLATYFAAQWLIALSNQRLDKARSG